MYFYKIQKLEINLAFTNIYRQWPDGKSFQQHAKVRWKFTEFETITIVKFKTFHLSKKKPKPISSHSSTPQPSKTAKLHFVSINLSVVDISYK